MKTQKAAQTHFIPTSELKLYNVVNESGEDLGQVQNFIIDMYSSRIAYVLIAFEGFLGLTDKWIPMPFEVLAWMPEKNRFEMDIPRKTMEKAPAISKSEWPDKFLGKLESRDHSAWLESVYEYFDCQPYWVEQGKTHGTEASQSGRMATHFIPTSRLKSYDVVGKTGEELGKVERIVVDMVSGRVAYMLVGLKGHLNDRWVAVPPDAMTWQPEKNRFELDIPRKTLEGAPTIPKADWPDKFLINLEKEDHARWLEQVYTYYNFTPFWIVVETEL